jgi:insulysin
LKARGWIESLGASAERFDAENALITVSIEITQEGEQHIDAITRALFQYIALIRADGVARWRYQEQAEVADLAFRFQEPAPPLGFVYGTAPNLRLYPLPEVLEAPYLMERYDEALIERYLDALRVDNLLMEKSGQKVDADKIEPWFRVPYRDQPLAIDLAAAPGDDFRLTLPAVNEFLPKDLQLQRQADAPPRQLDGGQGLALWWAPDASFGTPRATTYVQLNVAGGFLTAVDAAYASLYSRLVLDALNTFAYPAELAGLNYDISAQTSGFLLTLTGYDDKQPLLLDRILNVFGHVEPTAEKIASYRDELRRSWSNFAAGRPFEQGMASLSHVMIAGNWPPATLAAAIESVTPASLAAWRAQHLSSFSATVLLHGNADATQAKAVADIIETHVDLAPIAPNDETVARLPADDFTFKLDIDIDDASMTLYLQGADESFHERALFGLMGQILKTPYFNDLRTEQQLGYAVFVTPSVLRRTPGLAFVVQSPVAGASALVQATGKFLADYRRVLAAMSPAEFDDYKQGLIGRLLESDKNLGARSMRYWSDLDVGFTSFDSRVQIAAAIEAIDQPTLLAFYDRLLSLEAKQRLIIYNRGRFDEDPAGRPIDDVGEFRAAAGPFSTGAGTAPAAR